jgi:protein-arginine kinase activator protein McsA
MKNLMNAVIVNGVAYQINATEAKKVAQVLGLEVEQTTTKQSKESTTKSKAPKKSEPKTESKKSTRTVGSLECYGKFVRTVKGAFLSSKARYAIKMSATEDFGATKLGKGNKVYDTLAKEDKYVQIYEFKTVEDATKFMDAQSKRMAK